ncbi:acyltransferase [bacterium]|nr:acyltransferase [bacterium]
MSGLATRDENLDGLRGFAAAYVIFFHILINRTDLPQYSEIFRSIVSSGADMVSVFFVLSGYFIAESAASLLTSHRYPNRAFVIRRACRIMPVWILLLTYMLFTYQIAFDVYLGNLFFYFGNLEQVHNRWLPVIPAWTLQSEVIFYVVSAVFLRKIFNLKAVEAFALWLSCIVMAAVWNYISIEYFFVGRNSAYHFFFNQMYYFAAGIFIHKVKFWTHSAYLSAFKKEFWLLEICVIWLFLMSHHSHLSAVNMIILAPSLVFLLTFKESFLRQIFKRKLFVIMGYASFSIYILQSQCHGFISHHFPDFALIPNTLLNLIFAISVGLFVYYFVERPIIKWSKKI